MAVAGLREAKSNVKAIEEKIGDVRQTVVSRVVRFAGGQAAGAGGILELVDNKVKGAVLSGAAGLHFIPFSPRHSEMEHRAGVAGKPEEARVLHG